MSKGPGNIQEAILQALQDDRVWTAEALRWHLFEKKADSKLTEEGKLPTSWNTSFARAVERLADIERIEVNTRPLESFGECVENYPSKTLRADARQLRLELLPVLQAWTTERGGLQPKYGVEANEIHHFRTLPSPEGAKLESEWEELSERLRPLYGQVSKTAADQLLGLICKGKSLFHTGYGKSEVSVTGSLAYWLAAAEKCKVIPEPLLLDLHGFVHRFLPPSISKILNFKSYIHELTDVPQHGQCRLRKETLAYLMAKKGDVLRNLEGFKEINHSMRWPDQDLYSHSPDVLKLFDQTVFQSFDFLNLPADQR